MLLQQSINFLSLFLITALIVRNIPRDEYGQLALVLSYGLIFALFNIATSSILLRDYPKLTSEQLSNYMSSFYIFNAYKSCLFFLLTIVIGFYLYFAYGNSLLIIILIISTATIICQNYTEPLQVLFSVTFKQNLVTQIIFASSLFNVLSTFCILIWPSVLFVVLKNLLVAILTLVLFFLYFHRHFHFRIHLFSNRYIDLVFKNLSNFSSWSHLQGVFTDIMSRADILILGWLQTPFQTLGNYNIALQLSNMTRIVPQIVLYHTTLSVSNVIDGKRENEVVNAFLKANFVLSVCIMLGYLIFGKFLISVIAKTQFDIIYEYGLYILGGLCLRSLLGPLISYSIVLHSIKQAALTVNLPAAVFAVFAYFVGGIYWGVQGVLVANVLIAIVLSMLTVVYIKRKTNYRWSYSLITDYEMSLLKRIWPKLKK